jgi:hypothetical protein
MRSPDRRRRAAGSARVRRAPAGRAWSTPGRTRPWSARSPGGTQDRGTRRRTRPRQDRTEQIQLAEELRERLATLEGNMQRITDAMEQLSAKRNSA